MRIAVCEDDLACMTKLKCLFDQNIGYNANYFTTGREFLQKVEENAYYDITFEKKTRKSGATMV
ncbi:hypothetical protein D3Z48_21240 [Clostridiaceae bacterium]|nr:hypothetical protein [Clostridiaceae bacterium]